MSPQFVNGPDALLARIRHELRTPLNHILGYSEILVEEEFSGPFQPLLHAISAHSRETLAVIQKLLPAQFVPETFPPREAAAAWHSLFQNLRAAVCPHLDQIDELLRKARSQSPPNALADLDRIGVAGKKLRGTLSELTIAERTIPELAIAGTAGPDSARASGSEAVVSAPQRLAPHEEPAGTASAGAEQESTQAERSAASGAILVVDDNDLNRDMLSRQLIRQHHTVDTAQSGEEAIAMLHRNRYDILLLDVLMPGMNGFEVLEKVKRDPALRSVAVIVVSALDQMDSAIRCIELGAEDYLFKPVNPTLLRARMGSILARTRAEDALRRRQRFESIGMLAAGVAHDFNNLLTGMIGNAHLLSQVLPDQGDRDMADAIVRAGERAAELTRQLLAYAGKGAFLVTPLDLRSLIQETERLIRASLPGKAELRVDLHPVPKINADANQVKQALLNLTMNAAEALSPDGQNCVTIETGVEAVAEDARFDLGPEDIPPGSYVYLEVRDTGCGIDAKAMPQIFEPFYSTKFLGRGLGLAAVAGIVRTHGGMMRVTSAPGKGSSFRLYFPAIPVTPEAAATEREAAVLVIDDEPVIRQIAKLAIERCGHKVLLAENGAEGLAIFTNPPQRIGVVLLDLRMPEMGGEEVLRRLKAIEPNVQIIVSSGLPQREVEAQLGNSRVSGVLQKPYKMTELVTIVERCISSPNSQ